MGNIVKWGGPLPESWHNQTLILQRMILKRMLNLGIKPILPAFAGHVPRAIKRYLNAIRLATSLFEINFYFKLLNLI